MKTKLKQAKELNEPVLIYADIKKIMTDKEKHWSQTDLKKRSSASEIFWKMYFEDEWKKMIASQHEIMGKQVETAEQLLFVRGIIQGLGLVKEWFDAEVNASFERFNMSE